MKGQFIGIVGANGCGKTTLVKYLIGEYTSKKNVYSNAINWEKGKRLSYLSQLNTQGSNWPIYVEDYLTLFISNELEKNRSQELLTFFKLNELKGRILQHCSGGEKTKSHVS